MTSTRKAIGVDVVEPYSKMICTDELVYVKSQIGGDANGDYPADAGAQTRNTLEHLEHALEMAGTSLAEAVKISVYLSNIDRDFDAMDAAYLDFFAERGVRQLPARTTVGAALSWPQLLVQMDLIAAI